MHMVVWVNNKDQLLMFVSAFLLQQSNTFDCILLFNLLQVKPQILG